MKKIEFLGFKVSERGIEPSEKKIEPIKKYPRPTTKKEVISYVSFMNYYRKWVFKFAEIARPFYKLTKKDTPFTWGEEEENAFQILKQRLLEKPLLILPLFSRAFYIMVDSSGFACSAILTPYHPPPGLYSENEDRENIKETKDDVEVPIAFASKNSNEAQMKYGATT